MLCGMLTGILANDLFSSGCHTQIMKHLLPIISCFVVWGSLFFISFCSFLILLRHIDKHGFLLCSWRKLQLQRSLELCQSLADVLLKAEIK